MAKLLALYRWKCKMYGSHNCILYGWSSRVAGYYHYRDGWHCILRACSRIRNFPYMSPAICLSFSFSPISCSSFPYLSFFLFLSSLSFPLFLAFSLSLWVTLSVPPSPAISLSIACSLPLSVSSPLSVCLCCSLSLTLWQGLRLSVFVSVSACLSPVSAFFHLFFSRSLSRLFISS